MKTRILIFLCGILTASLTACGADDGVDTMADGPKAAALGAVDARYASQANAICREALDRTRQIGIAFTESELDARTPDLIALTTQKLVKPGIDIRRRMARELRELPPPTRGEASAAAYLDLFDPIEVLALQRLRAGLAHDLDGVSETEALMQQLAEEQQRAARLAGLRTCARSFLAEAFGDRSRR